MSAPHPHAPPPLRAPGGRPADGGAPPNPHAAAVETTFKGNDTGLRLGIALAFLLSLVLGVLFILPETVEPPPTIPTADQATPPPSPSNSTPQPQKDLATQAQALLEKTLERRAALELASAPIWAEADWQTLERDKRKADQALDQGRLNDAIQGYAHLSRAYLALENRREDYGRAWAQRAATAYASGDAAVAVAAGEKAHAALPDDPEIETRLARAQQLDRVLAQMRRADTAAQASNPSDEAQALQAALDLDPDYAPAAQRLRTLQKKRDAAAFQRAMGQTLAALNQGRLGNARKALDAAAKRRPNDPAVAAARTRLNDALRANRLDQIRRRALAAQSREDWAAAQTEYQQALRINAHSAFAQDGLDRAEARLQLHARLDRYLQRPERLYRPQPLADAERLLVAADQPHPNEPGLNRKLTQLRAHIDLAKTPIPVRLRSDGETDVTLRPVAHLGAFESRDLELRPGTYVLTGIRIGYRDARHVLQLRPGQAPPPIHIRCRERIE